MHYQVPIQESEAALDEAVAANNLDITIVDTPPGVEITPSRCEVLSAELTLC